jgi:xanthine/CO dehydrogenase XdhC/CoxF family maturation factor
MSRGDLPPNGGPRTLVTVFDSPVATYLQHFGRDAGFRTVLLEPDSDRLSWADWKYADHVTTSPSEEYIDRTTDVVLTDHDRPELGRVLEQMLRLPARWIGVMGSVRHTAPHVDQLRQMGVPDQIIARVHRPAGLNIGSHTPAEIAIAVLAGLIADRNRRPGGFVF